MFSITSQRRRRLSVAHMPMLGILSNVYRYKQWAMRLEDLDNGAPRAGHSADHCLALYIPIFPLGLAKFSIILLHGKLLYLSDANIVIGLQFNWISSFGSFVSRVPIEANEIERRFIYVYLNIMIWLKFALYPFWTCEWSTDVGWGNSAHSVMYPKVIIWISIIPGIDLWQIKVSFRSQTVFGWLSLFVMLISIWVLHFIRAFHFDGRSIEWRKKRHPKFNKISTIIVITKKKNKNVTENIDSISSATRWEWLLCDDPCSFAVVRQCEKFILHK